MTKSPNFFWQNGLLSKFFSNFFDFLKKWAAADKPCPQLQPTLLRRPFCQKKFGDFVIFLWPSQNIWTLSCYRTLVKPNLMVTFENHCTSNLWRPLLLTLESFQMSYIDMIFQMTNLTKAFWTNWTLRSVIDSVMFFVEMHS